LVLTACSNQVGLSPIAPRPAPSASVGGYQPEPARSDGGTVTVGDWESPSNFAPLFNDELTAAQVDAALYAGLTRLDANLRWQPDLASEVPTLDNRAVAWNRAAGSMDVTYHLRPGLTWSDGQPLTADDIAFTWRVIVDPHTSGVLTTDGYALISRIDIKDPLTFTLHFDRVYPEYLGLFSAILPAHRLQGIAFDHLAADTFWTRPDVVSGPYKISELVPDEHISLVRNDAWSAGRGGQRPHLDRIIYKVFPESGALIEAASAGQVDLALEVPEGALSGLASLKGVLPHFRSALAYEQVTFNQQDPNPLTGHSPPWANDPVVLQALALAADRQGINRDLLAGDAHLADSPIPSALGRYQAKGQGPAYDPGRANQLLDGDGWTVGADGIRVKGPQRLSFSLSTTIDNPLRLAVQDHLIADWRKVGAEVVAHDARPVDLFSGYAEGGMLARGQFEAGLWTWSIGPDPDGVYPIEHSSAIPSDKNDGKGSNFGRLQDADIDRLLDAGRASVVEADRAKTYAAFERAYAKAGAELPLYERVLTVLTMPRLHNVFVNPGPNTTLWNVQDWWVDG
jgi:peptide/nickel transport system substrate-binding protein